MEQLTTAYMNDIERFSQTHDIGKVAIQDGILLKPGLLSKGEYEIMKTHTEYGAKVMAEAERNINRCGRSLFQAGIEIAIGHHEWWDGGGYPKGLKEEAIPLSARVVALADVFDALTSKRPYKEAYPFDKAVQIISEGSGQHFDPNIVSVFIKYKELFKKLYREMKIVEVRSRQEA